MKLSDAVKFELSSLSCLMQNKQHEVSVREFKPEQLWSKSGVKSHENFQQRCLLTLGGGTLECQGGYQAHPKVHVIRVVFQDQAL